MNSLSIRDTDGFQVASQGSQQFLSVPLSHYPVIDYSRVHSVIYPLDASRGATQLIYGNDISLAVLAGAFVQYLVSNSKDIDEQIVSLVNKNFWDLLA
jgi:hypothetical protein